MIKIVTDSTAYLPETALREHDIRFVPLYVHFGVEAYRETVDLSNEEFYARLKAAAAMPTTSQPSAGEFLEVFRPLVDQGHEILALLISSKLSGTYASAMAARAMLPEASISVVDTLCTSIALQLMVYAAAEAIRGGATLVQVTEQMETMKTRIYTLFVVDTLEYLAKGGRIGNAKAFLGTMLSIKPILILKDGAIEPLEQVRSKRKAVARMLDLIQERVGSAGRQARLAVTHALVPEEADAVRQELVARLGCPAPCFSELGGVIGSHTGPGVVAVAAYV